MNRLYTYYNGKGGIKEVLDIALPMVISMAADTLMAFTDRLFLSKISPDHMNAAMGGSLGAQMLLFFMIGLTGFSTALVAQYFGANKKDKCASVFYQAVILCALFTPIVYLLKPLAIWVFENSIASTQQMELQNSYFSLLLYGAFFFLLRHALSCYFSGIGRTRIVMIANLTALVSNVCINYVLIFGKFGMPELGIQGAAIGSISAVSIACTILLFTFFTGLNRSEFTPQKATFYDKEVLFKLVKFGYPAGIEMFLNFGAFMGIMMVFYSHSAELATATSIVFNWDAVSFIPLIGIEIAVTSLFGRYIGQQKLAYAHRSTISALIIGSIFSFFVFVAFISIPELLCEIFKPIGESEIYENALPMAVTMLKIACIYVLTEAIILVFMGALRGAGDTLWTMFVSVGLHWFLLGTGFVMLKVLQINPITTWWAIVFTILLFAVAFLYRYRQGKWKDIKVVGV